MWFRFVLAIAASAVLGLLWVLLFVPPPADTADVGVRPGAATQK